MDISNEDFIKAVFGEDAPWCHVTGFPYDPSNIPKDRHLYAWKGDYFSRYQMEPNTNQYFTISTFYCDEESQARRRKALFRYTHCIVLDDVKEKLSMDEVSKLPSPSWVLESSTNSEQWGYILTEKCTDRGRIENLLDGLVANGLAPDGRDPGMKGVTRYVRLPEGINNKASKLVNGQPFKCRMLVWNPFNTVTLEQLATPFKVNLDAVRREARVDGAAAVSDHPLINIPEVIHVKEIRSDGRFDITCPWVTDHTGGDDSGSAVFTNSDGSIGFKCHHGNCQDRTGKDLLRYIDGRIPGFTANLKNWQIMREFSHIAAPANETVSFLAPSGSGIQEQKEKKEETPPALDVDTLQLLCDDLRRELPGTAEQRNFAAKVLKFVDDMPQIDRKYWHDTVTDIMRWSKSDFKDILKDLRATWYEDSHGDLGFTENMVFVKELNKFYDIKSRIFYTAEAFQNSFSSEDAEARKTALERGAVPKVDRLDYAPKAPKFFTEKGINYANTWEDDTQSNGKQGDCRMWLEHFNVVGWAEHRDHMVKWMAYTLRHPENKINHMLILGGGEGCGKDFLLFPLFRVMGDNSEIVSGEDFMDGFNEYLLSTKYLHLNEVEPIDMRDAKALGAKIKPLSATPPEYLRVNQKGISRVKVRNIVNVTMATNSTLPLRLNGTSRRIFAVWSELNVRDSMDNVRPEWAKYWTERWDWMDKQDGWESVVHYLMNEVDLSDFNPGAAPPMTEFLREIKEASKSDTLVTIENFIKRKHGYFAADVVTVNRLGETLRAGMMMPSDMLVDPKFFTDKKVTMLLKEAGCYKQVRTSAGRFWIIRNPEKYENMNTSELCKVFEEQIRQAQETTTLKAV